MSLARSSLSQPWLCFLRNYIFATVFSSWYPLRRQEQQYTQRKARVCDSFGYFPLCLFDPSCITSSVSSRHRILSFLRDKATSFNPDHLLNFYRIPLALLLHAIDLFNRAESYLGSSFIGHSQFFKYYFGSSHSFSYLAGPVVVILVLGWLLLVSTIVTAILVLLHRERTNSNAIANKEHI